MKTPDILGIALDALKKGIAPIPCVEGAKIPAVKWKEWQTKLPPEELVREWFSVRRNIALVTSGMVVFDCDDPELAERVLAECGDTPHKIRSPRGGIHLGYRARKAVVLGNQVKVKGLDIDIRTFGGIEVIPDSWTEDGEYAWLRGSGLRPIADLPLAKIAWTRERVRRTVCPVEICDDNEAMVRRARAYLGTVDGAISGQRGHNRTFRVACALVHKFGLTIAQAWPLLLEWNQRCKPPWSERELLHKLEDAVKKKR